MHVGILSQVYDPEPGGGAVSTVLARGLLERGHQVTVLTGFPNYPQGRLYPGYRVRPHLVETRDGVPVHRVPLWPNHSPTVRGRMANYLSFASSAATIGLGCLAPVDAVWTFCSEVTIGLPMLALRALGKPVLLHVQDLWPESVIHSGFVRNGRTLDVTTHVIRRWGDFVYSHASAVAATTPAMQEELIVRGADPSRTSVIYNWADEAVFCRTGTSHEARRPPGTAVLMYAGTLGHVQGLDTAVRAAACLRDRVPGFRLQLVGSGVAEQSLRALAAEVGATNVSFLTRRPPAEMGRLYRTADAQLVSLKPDPAFDQMLPSKLQAAFAAAKPVIACAQGETARTVDLAGAGLVVAPGDVTRLADTFRRFAEMDNSTRVSMGLSGRTYYTKHMSLACGIRAVEGLLTGEIAQVRARKGS